MISSLYSLAYSGKAYTTKFFVSSILRSIVSGSRMNGDFSPVPPSSTGSELLSVKVAFTSYLPLLEICKKLELTLLITSSLCLFSGSLPTSSGPKSKTFSETT